MRENLRDLLFFLTGLTIGGLVGFVVPSSVSYDLIRKLRASSKSDINNALSALDARVEKLEALPINWVPEICEIIELAAEIFGGDAEGAKWLRTSVADLGGAQPRDLMRTREGAEDVLTILKQLKTAKRLPSA